MTRACLFSILLLSGSLCAAQDGVTPTYTVRGTIVNAQTNRPIARAEVILNQEYAALTDNEGRFEFDQIPAGELEMSVRRPGYVGIGRGIEGGVRRGIPPSPQPARHIRVGPGMPDLTFRLMPACSIRGQVSLSTSDPSDGMRVSAYQKRSRNGLVRWEMAGSATTDSDGVFHFEDLAPGNYMLFTEPALDRPGAVARDAITWGYPAVYYPGVTDSASAGILTLAAGQSVEADFALTRQAFFPLTAQVRAVDAVGHAGFQILDSSGRFTNLPARYDTREQIVYANVPNGSWILQAQTFGPGHHFGRTSFQVTGGPVNIAITILPIPRLQVTVHHEFTSTADTPVMMGRSGGSGVDIQLQNAEPFSMGGMMSSQFEPAADSSADTTTGTIDASPGRYWVETNAWAGYVSSITSGGIDLADKPLVISPNSSNAPIEVVLRNDFGTITGRIANQSGNEDGAAPGSQVGEVPRIYVYAIPLSPAASRSLTIFLPSARPFTLSRLAPGSYRVIACDSEQEIDFHTPEGLAAWAGKGQVVAVDPGGTATVELNVLHEEQQP